MLWKTLYSLFRELPNEQEMYQSIASVGNMLLKLGEFGGELDTSGEKTAEQQLKSNALEQFVDPLHVAELESFTSYSVDLSAGPNELTVTSELGSSSLVKEVLIDAARSSESSLSSPVRSSNGDDFVLVGSDEGFSTPEQVPSEVKTTQDTLHEVYNKLSLGDPGSCSGGRSSVDGSAERISNPKDFNSHVLVVKQGDQITGNTANQSHGEPSYGTIEIDQLHGKLSSGTLEVDQVPGEPSSGALNTDQSNDKPSSGMLDTDQSNERPSSGALDLDWSICFEQFLASMLTEPYLVHYFEETVDVIQRLKKMKTEGIGSFRNASRTSLHSAE